MKLQGMKLIPVFAVLIALQTMAGCDAYVEPTKGIITGLLEKNCEINADPRVNDKRKVLLFARHHIFVAGKASQDGEWQPNEYTVSSSSGFKWKNSDLVAFRTNQIKSWMPEVNKILENAGTNIYIHTSSIDVHLDPQMFPAEVSYASGFLGHTAQVVSKLKKEEPEYIHVIWGWTATQNLTGVASDFCVVMCDDPKWGDKATEKSLAHEFVHAMGYETHDNISPKNLMSDGDRGVQLTKQQIDALWNQINGKIVDRGKKLVSLTCDK